MSVPAAITQCGLQQTKKASCVNECERRARKESKSNRSITNLSVCANDIMRRKWKKNEYLGENFGFSVAAYVRTVGKGKRVRGGVAPR